MSKTQQLEKFKQVAQSAPMQQEGSQATQNDHSLVVRFPKQWIERIKSHPSNYSMNQFIRSAIWEKIEKERL